MLSFSGFLSSYYDAKIVRRDGTPVTPGIVRDAFEAFVPDDEQTVLSPEVFDVTQKFRCDYMWTLKGGFFDMAH